MSIVRPVATGMAGGVAWGIAARAWMRLVSEHPEFTWSGTLFIVGAATIIGVLSGVATAATMRRWRAAPVLRVVAVVATVLLGVGAGSLVVPTIVLGGIALGVPGLDHVAWSWRVATAIAIVAIVGLVGIGPGSALRTAVVVVGALAVAALVVSGWHLRAVVAVLAVMPVIAVVSSLVTADLPMWRGLVGATLYLPIVAAPTTVVAWVLASGTGLGREAGAGRDGPGATAAAPEAVGAGGGVSGSIGR